MPSGSRLEDIVVRAVVEGQEAGAGYASKEIKSTQREGGQQRVTTQSKSHSQEVDERQMWWVKAAAAVVVVEV